tara:strand:- start:579 stop:737 length:159 start_codon:yes stop_codon:yes gene_type:complete
VYFFEERAGWSLGDVNKSRKENITSEKRGKENYRIKYEGGVCMKIPIGPAIR